MGMDKGGPSVMSMYTNAGPQGAVPDTGLQQGSQLYNAELAARTHYAAPSVPGPERLAGSGVSVGGNMNPNLVGGLPVKYDVPSAYKERFQDKQELREAIARKQGQNVMRVDPIGDDEVQYLQSMKDQSELADFDRYVNTLIDVRKPGNLKWLMEIYPQYVERRIQQVHTDYEFALRNQMIDSWGINTFDDLHFKYLVDQDKIDGPRLGRHVSVDDSYTPGLLSPWSFLPGNEIRAQNRLRLPFASAEYGARPDGGDRTAWELRNSGQPMSTGRTTEQLAQGMYPKDDDEWNILRKRDVDTREAYRARQAARA